jgi:hypothetical protein
MKIVAVCGTISGVLEIAVWGWVGRGWNFKSSDRWMTIERMGYSQIRNLRYMGACVTDPFRLLERGERA